ncbi:MAG: hypothetical protein WD022_01850 [Balneolaceae bacterium]
MSKSVIDISTFEQSSDFYGEIDLILTVKSFDLRAIRKRYIESRKNKSGKTGSVERRKPALGGVVSVRLANGRTEKQEVLCKTPEPRGLDLNHGRFAIANEQAVFVIEESGKNLTIQDPWFSYIHTVQFHPANPDHILISSSGFDLIQEYDYRSKDLTFEWLAWEHGFNKAKDPETGKSVMLTRNLKEAKILEQEGIDHLLVQNPETDHLPTAKRAAFINSVTYHPQDPNTLLATFFHEGKVYQINKKTMKAEVVLSGLKNPHGGHFTGHQLIATSTGSGEIFIKKKGQLIRLSTKNLAGKPDYLIDMEWIQNSLSYNGFLVAIDSNRTSFLVIDPKNHRYDIIPYDDNWAVQDLVAGTLKSAQKSSLSAII